MLNVAKATVLTGFKDLSRILDLPGPLCVQVATVMKLKPPLNYDHVQYPARRRPKPLEKRPIMPHFVGLPPLQRKMPHLIKGPEEHHNRILYGEYAVQALEGGRLHSGHIEGMRIVVIRAMNEKTMFGHWRIPAPWLAVSDKGLNHKMGQGKGPIDRFEVPVKANRIIMEIGGAIELLECKKILTRLVDMLPMKARIVSRESLARDEEYQKQLIEKNQNPFTFRYCAQNNFLGIDRFLSPYDYVWDGKYNKKSRKKGR